MSAMAPPVVFSHDITLISSGKEREGIGCPEGTNGYGASVTLDTDACVGLGYYKNLRLQWCRSGTNGQI